MKKIISSMLAVVLSTAMLTGCGEKAAVPETTGEATQQQAETTTTEEETAKSDVTLNVAMNYSQVSGHKKSIKFFRSKFKHSAPSIIFLLRLE